MSYLNTAPHAQAVSFPIKAYHAETPLEQYDLNFCFPVTRLESDAIVLEPLIPSRHAREAYENISSPEGRHVFDYLPFPVPPSFEDYLSMIEGPRGRQNTEWCHFAIIDKMHNPPHMAGQISLLNSSVTTLSTEIGCVLIFPKYQRTHINTHANALLLRYCFEVLHLRRVQWKANSQNERSVKAAQRLGFQLEGIIRWERTTPQNGSAVENSSGHGRPEAGLGRHSVLLAICWDTWLESAKARIEELMAQPVTKR